MRVVFLGTPDFAVPTFSALCDSYDVVAAICQPDRSKDRKGNVITGAVKTEALKRGVPVYQFEKIKLEGVQTIKDLAPDLMVTCAYGQILSKEILDIPKYGTLNVHGSILPSLRGSAPMQWCLINGDKQTGISIMKTDVGMDTGDVLTIEKIDIDDDTYISELSDKLKIIGANLLIKTIPLYLEGKIIPKKQDNSAATTCRMLTKDDAKINFEDSAISIRNKIRGIGYGFFIYNNEQIKVFKADLTDVSDESGKVVSLDKKGLEIACGEGGIVFTELQVPGKKRMNATEFSNGLKISGKI